MRRNFSIVTGRRGGKGTVRDVNDEGYGMGNPTKETSSMKDVSIRTEDKGSVTSRGGTSSMKDDRMDRNRVGPLAAERCSARKERKIKGRKWTSCLKRTPISDGSKVKPWSNKIDHDIT